MGMNKLIKHLKDYLEKAETSDKARCDRIDELLEKLKEKQHKLLKKLDSEKSAKKRKALRSELKILAVQLKKGKNRRKELSEKCT